MSTPAPPPQPIAEEALDKMIGVLEGPVNKVAERVLSSTIVLAPLALSMNVGLRALAWVTKRNKDNGRRA